VDQCIIERAPHPWPLPLSRTPHPAPSAPPPFPHHLPITTFFSQAHELFTSGKATLLDLRTQWQFARERVPGAANVPAGEPGPSGLLFHFRPGFEDELRTLHPPDAAPLLLICELGVVSLVAANRLLDHGWRDVSVVRGGLEAWRDEALPTEETAAAGGDFSGATEAEEGEEAHLREEAGEAEWWRSAVGAETPEWTVAEGEEPGMWPVSGPDPLDELLDADGGEGGQFGMGLDELELEDFPLFGEEEAPPPSPLDAVRLPPPPPPAASPRRTPPRRHRHYTTATSLLPCRHHPPRRRHHPSPLPPSSSSCPPHPLHPCPLHL
jgi:rhodanese-related sulfurtransferase